MSTTAFSITTRDRNRLHHRAYRRQQRDQGEVCGALVQKSAGRRLELVFLENRSDRPGSFELDAQEVARVRAIARRRQQRIVGYFHSHPVSTAVPSPGDLADMPLRAHVLIYDVCGREMRLWYITMRSGKRVAVERPLVTTRRSFKRLRASRG